MGVGDIVFVFVVCGLCEILSNIVVVNRNVCVLDMVVCGSVMCMCLWLLCIVCDVYSICPNDMCCVCE